MLSGILKEFVMRSIESGCSMPARNEKHHTKIPLSVFDAVSLYHSAMRRIWTVSGTPRVIPPEHLSLEYLLMHSLTEKQTEPDPIRFISPHVAEIEIILIGKPRDFPLIRVKEGNKLNYINKSTKLIVDKITLEDLVTFQHISCNIIQGIYWITERSNIIKN